MPGYRVSSSVCMREIVTVFDMESIVWALWEELYGIWEAARDDGDTVPGGKW